MTKVKGDRSSIFLVEPKNKYANYLDKDNEKSKKSFFFCVIKKMFSL
ncbi:hypothetical protein RU98_GL001801 [Enterococcus caccae]|nr:hypothetical protein RU98_GL001801 [Enterococcus caccae]